MKQNRQSKVVAILALCVSVVGLTLGFAAFSNTLTISSSATVKPDQKDFKIVAYGIEDQSQELTSRLSDPELYTSSTISKPYTNNEFTATDAKIESTVSESGSTQITITNLKPTFKNPGDSVSYYFMLKNEGQYDAYLALDNFKFSSQGKTCEPVVKEGESIATDSLVQEACKEINLDAQIYRDGASLMSIYSTNIPDVYLSKYADDEYNGIAILEVSIIYQKNSTRADGDFTITLPDLNMEFLTIPVVE